MLPLVLRELETPRALGLAMLAEHNKEVAIRTHSQLPPGVQLHVLTIGISAYNAKNLQLHYADRDAHDLASALATTQDGLYSHVDEQVLVNSDASKEGILRGLQTLRTAMERTEPLGVAGALRGMAKRPDRRGLLATISVPTLVMVGEHDVITPPAEARSMADAIPGSQFALIPNAGHMAPYENAAAANQVLLEFLNSLEDRR